MTMSPLPSDIELPTADRDDMNRRFRRRQRWDRALRWVWGARYRHGVTRWVFLVGKRAYKVPRFDSGLSLFLTGWLANRKERRAWRAANELWLGDATGGPHPREVLAPVEGMYGCGLVLAMRRCEFPDPHVMEAFLENLDRAWWSYYSTDLHAGNFALLDGRMVCIDYSD